jgi:type 1 glutamine amidotransferase
MKSLRRLLGLLLLVSTCVAVASAAAPAKKKVLFFSKSSGFEHDAINLKMKDGRPGYAFAVLKELGEKNNIEFTFSKDGSLFTPEYLAQFDAYFFYTTGVLTRNKDSIGRGDDNPPMTEAGKAALLQAIKNGKGFVGTHSATDTFHATDDDEQGPMRFSQDGPKTDPYVRMIGGGFIRHGAQQKSHIIVADPKFPGVSGLPADFGPMEEWYTFKNLAPDLHVILVQDTAGMTGPDYARPPYPETWARMEGKGRVFYTSLGHREDIWNSAAFQSLLTGGLDWALGRVEADVTPNIDKVTPQANTLQKFVPSPPKQKQ